MLTTCKNALKQTGHLNKIENPDSLQRVVEKLPFGLRLKWRDVADEITEVKQSEITIEDIAIFVEKRAKVSNHTFLHRKPANPDNGQKSEEPKNKNANSQQTPPVSESNAQNGYVNVGDKRRESRVVGLPIDPVKVNLGGGVYMREGDL